VTESDTSTALVPVGLGVGEDARDYIAASRSKATLRAYQSDLRDFERYCEESGRAALPAEPAVVADYLARLAHQGLAASTIGRRVVAIGVGHRMAGVPSPTGAEVVRLSLAGIRRSLGTRQKQARALDIPSLRAMVRALPDDLRGARDRALLLVGFAAGLRRSEVVGLNADDVVEEPQGLRLMLRRSKTDQTGEGRQIAILRGRRTDTDPVAALAAWREASGVADGPLFRSIHVSGKLGARLSGIDVNRIMVRAAKSAGLDATGYSGHSLRAGLATSAAASGASERSIQAVTGHKSTTMLRRYIRAGSLFQETVTTLDL
jgi:site-specific recombinase XerD